MKTKLLSGLFILGLFASFALPADAQGAPAPLSSNPGEITVVRVRGEVFTTVKATNVKNPLQDNAKISQGSVVSTGKDSSVVLVFSNGATINLGKNSSLDIEQFTQDPFSGNVNAADIKDEPSRSTTRLNLTHGELVGKVAHLKKEQGSSFTVDTPVGAAGIRGTIFRIVYIPDGNGKATFSMTTLEGSVAVSMGSGTSKAPPVAVTGNSQITVEVDITVNATTGAITITPVNPNTPVVSTPASAASLTAITASAQQIADAVAKVVIAPPANTGSAGTPTPTPTPVTTTDQTVTVAPPATTPDSRTL